MTALTKLPEQDPFNEPLSPLPTMPPKRESAQKPEAVMPSVAMDPEKILPPEDPEPDNVLPMNEPGALDTVLVTEEEPVREPAPPRWMFWKRPSKRDQQMDTLRHGAAEMVGLMRSIRDHLEEETADRKGLKQSLSPLPVAVENLKKMSEHQADTGKVLGELRESIDRRSEKDAVMIKSLSRIGNTMSNVEEAFGLMDRTLHGIDRSNQRTVSTMQKLGQRVTDSDRFMNETFERLRDAEREFTEIITKNSRRSSYGMMALCSILMVSVVAVGFMFRENRQLLSAVQQNGALVVQVPRAEPDNRRMALFEDLDQVEDRGIGEQDREIAAKPLPASVESKPGEGEIVEPVAEPVPEEGTEDALLSINKLPRRE